MRLMLLLVLGLAQTAWSSSQTGEARDQALVQYKFLLIDDQPLLETHKLQRTVNQAEKRRDPVMRLDAPWETDRDMLNTAHVKYDQEEDIFKMWYTLMRWEGKTADGPRGVAYATSEDGLRWSKPVLGLVESNGSRENNMIFPFMHHIGYSILKDHSDVPARRYKMIFDAFGEDPGGPGTM